MELFFRKYFWVVNFAFLLGAAYFSARIANAIIAGQLQPSLSAQVASRGVSAARGEDKKRLSAEALSKLTGLPLPESALTSGSGAAGKSGAMSGEIVDVPALPDLEQQEAVRTSLRLKLRGTSVANLPEWSVANIEDLTEGSSSVYMIGDQIQEAEVIQIELKRVYINNAGRKEYIDAEEPGGAGAPKVAKAAATKVPNNNTGDESSGIRALSANNYEIPKEELQKAMGNLNSLATQARVVPSFKNGESQGFKIFSIKPNSLFSKLGIQNGDIVKRVNGFDINSPDKALEIYSKLQNSSRIEIEFERGGSPVRKTYNVR